MKVNHLTVSDGRRCVRRWQTINTELSKLSDCPGTKEREVEHATGDEPVRRPSEVLWLQIYVAENYSHQ
jgi:hypothetical protein